ncbi:uncharacterized protein LOC102806898 [Saccoglossus kowalevskii]|uniref:Uncharacterized protein LOC102806898 n=1 Tax=Saccoglossus kowalevskii TaxID=10224 RepID=A0ABM0M5A3_SACKO|nr:PREDICTED: uncharacterized protein LOC102806898 [Saccoglossus kowalevskii]
MARQNCDFVLNIPASSYMGGVWERQIGSIRRILAGIMNQVGTRPNTSSFRTLMYEVEAIVNSRPLTVENVNDPTGPIPLTPNQILTMKSHIILPPPGVFVKADIYARKRWRVIQHLVNEF